MDDKTKQSKKDQMRQQDKVIETILSRVKHKLLVLSGKGGVGKSTVAVNLAVALAEAGYQVGLMDVDLHGPSVPRLMGLVNVNAGISGGQISPVYYQDNLKVVSIENLLPRHDDALIWRGPIKIGVIRQFLADVAWGELDYLVIDSPPGTGDEPLTIAQTIPGARAIIVTTPQEVSLADVRKSINFCRAVDLPILGIIENMSGYVCPGCGRKEDIFGSGGGERTARQMNLPLLGSIPLDPNVMMSGDGGNPVISDEGDSPVAKSFRNIVQAIVAASVEIPLSNVHPTPHECGGSKHEGCGGRHSFAEHSSAARSDGKKEKVPQPERTDMKIVIPASNGLLSNHFGHCEEFLMFDVKDSKILRTESLTAPPHEPGVLPRWLSERGANVIIAGGMGMRAQAFFKEYDIMVVTGAPVAEPRKIVEDYLAGALEAGDNVCDH